MITINGEYTPHKFTTLKDVCEFYTEDPEAVATALNGDFIPKSVREETIIHNGDHIEIIAPLEGG